MTLAVSLSLSLVALVATAEPRGVVVDEVEPGYAAQQAGLVAGDLLLRWERAPSLPANPEAAEGELRTPFDVLRVEREQAPRGAVTLRGRRDGRPLAVRVPPGEWRLTARPPLADRDLAAYEEGGNRADGVDHAQAELAWARLAVRLRDAGDDAAARWVSVKVGTSAAKRGDGATAERAFAEALTDAGPLDVAWVAVIHTLRGEAFQAASEWERAVAAYRAALAAEGKDGPPSLAQSWIHNQLGRIAHIRGDVAAAEDHLRRALELREKLAPGSADLARTLLNLGLAAQARGDLDLAEQYHRRGLAIYEELAFAPGVGRSHNNLGLLASARGDLETAEQHLQRARSLEPGRNSVQLAAVLTNLGVVAVRRGNLAGAEEHYRQAIAIQEKLGPSVDLAGSIHNLAGVALLRGDLAAAAEYSARALALGEKLAPESVAMGRFLTRMGMLAEARGDLVAAERHLRRALAVKEKISPDSLDFCFTLNQLASLALQRGDVEGARAHLHRALTIEERRGSTGEEASLTHDLLGQVALASGQAAEAESRYRRSLELLRGIAPRTAGEARVCLHLAALHRRQGLRHEALDDYRCALDAVEAQRRTLGGTDEIKATFAARYASYYGEAVDLLVEMGRPEEAFHLVERYRARGLLALLAERDLAFSADVSPELDQERRRLNTEYDGALARRRGSPAEVAKARDTLARVRRQQAVTEEKIRAASPRLAGLQYPEPLDLPAVRAILDPGTLLLSYLVGPDRSYVFAVGPGPADFTVVPLALGAGRLRPDVARFRQLLEQPRVLARREVAALASRLADALLEPVAELIRRAQRLLVLPDGPLHLLPFAALRDPTSPARRAYLAETRPVHVAASATIFAELKRGRRTNRPARLIAFADPDYSAVAPRKQPETLAPEVLSAQERGLDLRPLPAARREVAGVKALYAGAAQVFMGREATEEKAKAIGREASLIHFACHGLADEGSPLDSSLALTLPARWQPGRDNGLLQAWEVFEQVRIDADLVTLSACSTALGKEMSGEGVLGLTRAFQYAGARSVLASLWNVSDESTGELMKRFYRHLQQGRSKDVALQMAQVEMIRRPASSHPYHWAAFQLAGDWR